MGDLASLPAPRWLVQDLIPDRGLGLIIGAPTAGKSFLLLEVAQSVCRGVPVFGDPRLMPTRTGWVLALLPEASASWAVRTRAYCAYHGLGLDSRFLCCIQQNDLADRRTWRLVMQAIAAETSSRGEPPTLTVVDTLSASIPGHDENSQAEMSRLISNLQMLVNMGTCVIVSHHTSKYGRTYRGSSVLLGGCDWMLSVIQTRRVRELVAVKLRDAERIANTTFEIRSFGESAVCIAADECGPWGEFEAITSAHPGLLSALQEHGFRLPGEERTDPGQAGICGAGVSLKILQAAWNRLDPIVPTHADNPAAYKTAHGARTTVLLGIADALRRGGVLEVTMGELSRKSRNLAAVVRQVTNHDDE